VVVDEIGDRLLELLAAWAPGRGFRPAALEEAAPKVRGQRLGVTFHDPHIQVNPRLGRSAPEPRNAGTDLVTLLRMAEVEARQADITELEVDAISNAANTDLRHGGGVAGAIVRAGGRAIQDESDRVAPIQIGQAVATGAGELPARWVIHAATMQLGGPTSAEAIRSATASTLRVADELGARSLGLVAFGTGVGGFPVDEAARIEVEEVRRHLESDTGLERIVFCVVGEDAQRAFDRALAT
jgi:O-acetyl-ADP-ribose deacetylase